MSEWLTSGAEPFLRPASEQRNTPEDVRLGVRVQIQLDLFKERYGHPMETPADTNQWEADGCAERFTQLLKDPEIRALIEQRDLAAAKVKIREKLFT